MLSRISRLGAHVLNRARPGQNLVTSRNHEVEAIISYMNPVGNNFFCSATNAEASERSNEPEAKISVTFVDKDGEEKLVKVPIGMSMLEAAHENDIELEGACEGSLACSTCHVIVTDVDYYNKLEDPVDEENDMLDLAFGLTETSRLGCQVIASPELDGIRLALPTATRNFAVDGLQCELGNTIWERSVITNWWRVTINLICQFTVAGKRCWYSVSDVAEGAGPGAP